MPLETVESVAAITLEQLQALAADAHQPAKGDGGPSGQAAPAGGGGPREGWTPWEVPEGQEVDIAAMYVSPDFSKARSFRLDNGMKVVIVPFGDAPTVRAKLMFAGGEVQEPAPGAAAASHELVWYDTRPLDITLQDAVASIGGTWLRWQTLDTTLFDLSASSGNLDGLLYLTRMLGAGAVTEMTQTWWTPGGSPRCACSPVGRTSPGSGPNARGWSPCSARTRWAWSTGTSVPSA